MASADLYAWLIEATCATSAVLLVVLALRRPLRAMFDAGASHAAWSAVPVALLATLLPAAQADAPMASLAVLRAPIQALAMEAPRDPAPDVAAWACVTWLCGCVAFAAFLWWQQRRFVHGLGDITDRGDGVLLAGAVAGLPAVVGVWKPRIVMPADAMSRYDSVERSLMLAHEREHIARGDLLANAFVAVLRCLFWFNPLMHFAARRFRDDLELACDARVIARHPHARRAYGEAMLKTQMAPATLPFGCHWGQSHPLKERIEMLKQPRLSSTRRIGGRALVIAILLTAGYAAWAAQPPTSGIGDASLQATDFTAEIELKLDDEPAQEFRISNRFATPFSVRGEGASGHYRIEATIAPTRHDGMQAYRVETNISRNGHMQASPVMVVRAGSPASLRQGVDSADGRFKGIELTMRLLPAADAARFEPSTPRRSRPTTTRANDWNSYEQLVGSLSASWQAPAAPVDDC